MRNENVNKPQNQQSCKTLLCLVFYLVTNETDRTIESCFYKLLDAKRM
jgi:hypothetical protein